MIFFGWFGPRWLFGTHQHWSSAMLRFSEIKRTEDSCFPLPPPTHCSTTGANTPGGPSKGTLSCLLPAQHRSTLKDRHVQRNTMTDVRTRSLQPPSPFFLGLECSISRCRVLSTPTTPIPSPQYVPSQQTRKAHPRWRQCNKRGKGKKLVPESLGRTSTLHASLVVSEIVEPYGSSSTELEPWGHKRLPSMFSAAAPKSPT